MLEEAHITKPDPRRTRRLLRGFDRAVARSRGVLDTRYGASLASELIAEARSEFARLAPEVPDLHGRQPFSQFVAATGWFLAFHRALARRGRPVREAGEFAYALTARHVESLPRLAARLLHRLWFSRLFRRRVRLRARQSQTRSLRGDFVYEYLEGDGAFEYGVDYHECAVWSFLQAQGAPDLAPYVCALDQIYSEAFDWGLVRTTTLAEGGARCDFRFARDRKTSIVSSVLPVQVHRGRLT